MNILLVNWQDVRNPQAGGAEIHLFEIFSRLAARGHRVRLICSNWVGGEAQEEVRGIEVHRFGGRHSFALQARGAVRRALRAERADIVCEDINKLPLFLAGMTPLPFCAIIPHLFGSTAFEEASWPMAATVWLAEQPIALAYRRAGFHAISESTRDDLVARGVAREQIQVIHPGVDCVRYHPDPAVGRTADPTFVYVGRLKRYKKVTVAIQALALARRERPELRLDIAGGGDHLEELQQLAQGDGPDGRGAVPGVRERRGEGATLPQRLGQRLSVAQGRVGYHGDGGSGLRHAVDCLRQSGAARLGARGGDRMAGAAW